MLFSDSVARLSLRSWMFLVWAGLILFTACGGSRRAARSAEDAASLTPLSPSAYQDEERRYFSLALKDPERSSLRQLLVATVVQETQGMLNEHDYDAVIVQLRRTTSLFTPEEFAPGYFPAFLRPVVEFVAKEGLPKGDEARVLSSYLLLSLLEPDAGYGSKYDEVAVWGRDARAGMEDVIRRFDDLLAVWEEHAQLTPSTSVLSQLADLYTLRKDAVVTVFEDSPEQASPRFRAVANRIWRLASLDVSAVYLQHGDIDSAITRVEAMGPGGEIELRLLDILRRGRADTTDGADATMELTEAFQIARPEVAEGLCRSGLRRFPKDYRFPTCLARIASDQDEHADATAWYLDAISLAPGLRELYDESLVRLDRFIEGQLIDSNPSQPRALARRAEQILTARQQRWPDSQPPLAPERLQYLVGMLEMNAGHAEEAKRRLQTSLELGENAPALLQLGTLLERTGDPAQAEARYRRALELSPAQTEPERLRRAEILERLGDAVVAQGDSGRAATLYQRALEIWSDASTDLQGPAVAILEIRRGVLLDHLKQHDEAVAAFQAAMAAAPRWRETYASILSHMVTSEPDLPFATLVWQRAQLQLPLPPEWKVYFTLWVDIIAVRAGSKPLTQALELLSRLGKSSTWWGNLAKFGAGNLEYSELLALSTSLGEKTEAYFYEGTRLMAQGDRAGARQQFERVLSTEMVSFFEYEMARGLLHSIKTQQ